VRPPSGITDIPLSRAGRNSARFFVPGVKTAEKKDDPTEAKPKQMIESPQNEKLKLVRKLRERKHREREGLFATEGEDLLEAGLAAGVEPRLVLVAAGSGLEGEVVEPGLLADISTLGSGTRVIAAWPLLWADAHPSPCFYLHGVGDPGNVGTIIRTVDALNGSSVILGGDCADPFSPKAVRASMGSIFSRPPLQAGIEATPEPRVAFVPHGGEELDTLSGAATVCLGAEREGLPEDVLAQCERSVTIPLREGGPDSLNVAAAAAIAAQRISSLAMPEAQPDA
jgi:TrmH family RNA methyltransferase